MSDHFQVHDGLLIDLDEVAALARSSEGSRWIIQYKDNEQHTYVDDGQSAALQNALVASGFFRASPDLLIHTRGVLQLALWDEQDRLWRVLYRAENQTISRILTADQAQQLAQWLLARPRSGKQGKA